MKLRIYFRSRSKLAMKLRIHFSSRSKLALIRMAALVVLTNIASAQLLDSPRSLQPPPSFQSARSPEPLRPSLPARSLQFPLAPSCYPGSGRSLRLRLPALMDSAMIPGLALALIDGDKVVWRGGFGASDPKGGKVSAERTVFEAASLSKPVVAYAALKLVDAGQLDLDRPLITYTPYPDFHGDTLGNRVTARMVLSHTSGLQNERTGSDSLRFSFVPGARFQYSGEGFVLLGKAIEAITAHSLAESMKSLVLEPLAMNRSSFVWETRFEDDAATGHGRFGETSKRTLTRCARSPSSLQTTAADYARFLVAVAQGVGLKPETWRLMQTPAVEVAPGVSWGLGWAIEKDSTATDLAHHGDNSDSGFTAFSLLAVDRQCGLVYFAN